ncbi:MAG: non-canonical purine NTP pyrophosphatase, partial [Clostridium sp.]
ENVSFENRKARFICQLAIIDSNKNYKSVTGYVEGHILEEINGDGGFGYDPLFYCDKLKKSFGEANSIEKNLVSHRGRALMKIKLAIKEFL